MQDTVSYNYSFTGASLIVQDFMRLARYVDEQDLYEQLNTVDPDKIMRREKSGTNKREFQELMKRYKSLSLSQKKCLLRVDAEGQRQLAFLGACKTYSFLHDFVLELVRDKFFLLDYELTDGDYNSFINRKLIQHPELDEFAPSTAKKARQVVFKMLEEAALINNTRERIILPQFLNQLVLESVLEEDADLLKLFLFSDQDINLMLHET